MTKNTNTIGQSLSDEEDQVLEKLRDVNKNFQELGDDLVNMYDELTNIQKFLLETNKYRNSSDINLSISRVMNIKERLKKLNLNTFGILEHYTEKLDHMRMLKKYIKSDEYLREEWNKILFYMAMKK